MNQIGSLWKHILEQEYSQPGWHTRRICPDAVPDIRIAILEPQKTPALLVEVASSAIPSSGNYPVSKGFEVLPENIAPGPHGRVRLCLLLSDKTYEDVFEVLCEDVADTVATAVSDTGAVKSFVSRLRVWQRFMKNYGPDGLGTEGQTGLFGELFFFRETLLEHLRPAEAVKSWHGPGGGTQDFQTLSASVEVKSTTAFPPIHIQISNLAQLDETLTSVNLLLCHQIFHIGKPPGLTLPEIIRHIRKKLKKEDESALILFNDRLTEAGYLDSHKKYYENRHYHLRYIRYFEIKGNFPRICASEVRKGVVSGSYGIEFGACLPFEINADKASTLMFGVTDG